MPSHIFKTKLFRYPGKGGWTFATVPKKHAPASTLAWGRTPVIAVMNGTEWRTSVWTEKSGRVLLPLPKKLRGSLGDGDMVTLEITYLI